MNQKKLLTSTFQETQTIGEQIGKSLQGGEVICLYGDLGSGKTTFTQGLAKGLGIAGNIISPTFIIMRTYEVGRKTQEARLKTFYHVDLYRITSERDIEGLGLLEICHDPESVVVIEWAEKLQSLLPKKRMDIHFRYSADDKREISIIHE